MRTEIFKLFLCFDFSTPYIKAFLCENHKKHRNFLFGETQISLCLRQFVQRFIIGLQKADGWPDNMMEYFVILLKII